MGLFSSSWQLSCLQLISLAPVGDVIQGKGKVCFLLLKASPHER